MLDVKDRNCENCMEGANNDVVCGGCVDGDLWSDGSCPDCSKLQAELDKVRELLEKYRSKDCDTCAFQKYLLELCGDCGEREESNWKPITLPKKEDKENENG